ncbi:hypothetical protein CK203_095624 [Vitis vinifera]|uniref:Uncharacterized protein n=1 Tax=Vitis vinifera TaxID=29760 RepID=A0A438FGV5_VITVI|nr:hypothetical protein CK203_095624 [Vitis vinifera]
MLLVDGIKKTVGISKISFLGCFYLYGSSQFQWLQESLLEFSSLPHFECNVAFSMSQIQTPPEQVTEGIIWPKNQVGITPVPANMIIIETVIVGEVGCHPRGALSSPLSHGHGVDAIFLWVWVKKLDDGISEVGHQ